MLSIESLMDQKNKENKREERLAENNAYCRSQMYDLNSSKNRIFCMGDKDSDRRPLKHSVHYQSPLPGERI